MTSLQVPEVGTELVNPVAGTRTVFTATAASTDGAYVEVEQHYPPHSHQPPRHLHPQQDEHFTVLSGTLHAVVDGVEQDLPAGSVLEVPRGAAHQMWNDGDDPAVLRWRTTPALHTDQMFLDLWAAAAAKDFQPDPLGQYEVVCRYPEQFQLC